MPSRAAIAVESPRLDGHMINEEGLGEPLEPSPSMSILRPSSLPGVEILRFRAWQTPWRTTRSMFELCLVERGGAEWRVGRRSYVSTHGSVHVVPSDTFHCSTRPVTSGDFTVVLIPDAAMAGESPDGSPALRPNTHKVDASRLSARISVLVRAVSSADDPFLAEGALVEAIDATRAMVGHALPDVGREPVALRRMRELLHDELATALTLSEVAAVGGLRRHQAVRLFKRELGVTPFEYLAHMRLSRATDLLRAGVSAGTAAHETGFSDQSHLWRWFKRTTGMTPGAYVRAGRRV